MMGLQLHAPHILLLHCMSPSTNQWWCIKVKQKLERHHSLQGNGIFALNKLFNFTIWKEFRNGGPMWSNKKIILKLNINKNIRWGIFSSQIISFFVNKVPYSKIKSIKENWVFVINQFVTICNYLSFVTIIGYFFNYFLHLVVLTTTLWLFFFHSPIWTIFNMVFV